MRPPALGRHDQQGYTHTERQTEQHTRLEVKGFYGFMERGARGFTAARAPSFYLLSARGETPPPSREHFVRSESARRPMFGPYRGRLRGTAQTGGGVAAG